MCEKERQLAENIVAASRALPDAKKEFLFGFAEGVIAATERRQEQEAKSPPEDT